MSNNRVSVFLASLFTLSAAIGAESAAEGGGGVSPFLFSGGLIALLVCILLEEFRLRRALRAARAASAAKTNFLATISHEIRTPLNAVIGFSEFLARPGLTEDDIREYAEGIQTSSDSLLSLLNDVLDLAKLESRQLGVFDGECDPSQVFAEVKSMFEFRCAEKGLHLTFTIGEMPRVKLNGSCLRQIIFNIIGNAVKFTYSGGVSCKASAATEEDGTVSLIIVIRDTGCGIPKERLGQIFDPFTQAADVRRDKVYRSTGLGLPIVKRLVDAAGGTIDVDSDEGSGSSFVVRLPHLAVMGESTARVGIKEAYEASAKATDITKLSVLIVDDVPLNLKVLFVHLKGLGITDVRSTDAAEEAVKLIEERKPDVVLTDMWMPEMNGEQLVTVLRQNPRLADVKVIAVTADAFAAETFDISVFDGLVTKPVTAEGLRDALAKIIGA